MVPAGDNGGRDQKMSSEPSRDASTSPRSPSTRDADSRPRLNLSDVHRDNSSGQNTIDAGISACSPSSDKQLVGSPGTTTDRVFPIRSVVTVDPLQASGGLLGRSAADTHDGYFPPSAVPVDGTGNTQRTRHGQSVSEADGRPTPRAPVNPNERSGTRENRRSSAAATLGGSDKYGGGSRMQLFSDASSEKSTGDSVGTSSTHKTNSFVDRPSGDQDRIDPLVTARFKHMITAEGHAVITGRDGETLQRCEDEPIHIPGAVQSFGLLVALEEVEDSHLTVRVVSENSYRMIGYHPQDLFKLNNFTDILSDEQCDNLLDHIDFIRDEETDPATNGPEVFTISVKATQSGRKSTKLWCAMHVNPSNPDLIICEFELDDDQTYPLVPPSEVTSEPPEDTLNSNPTQEEYVESTKNTSKPLRVLRSARKRRGEAAAMEVFNIMSQVQEQLASAPNLDTFLKILVGVVKELTGFHRVMIYQFDANFNGRVVTELVDPRATKDLYKGLNFPASDIPRQARELYKINKVRLLYDRDLETSRLVCRTVEDLEHPLDLSFSYLRAISPIHIKYLTNMAVRGSMSISINAFNELWGLIACHSYGSKGMRVSFPIRKMCRLVGDTASRNIERLSYASRLQARKLINTVPTEANPSGYIIASSDDLLRLFDADFGLLSIRGETKIMGRIDHSQEALAMLEYLRLRKFTSVVTSQDIREDFPDLRYSPGFDVIAGALLVPLSVGGNDFIVFFRKGQTKEVKWAGNPYQKFIKEGTEGYLEPRKSFKTWSETVVGKCRDWTEEQVETAAVLCLVYGKFIEVWRQKEAALQSSELTRILLANSAHEVRTPLNAIINYLEIALEGTLDQETRESLIKSHSASKSLIYVINDLLDLTKTEEGQDLIKDEIFNLSSTISEATASFRGEAKRKGLEYEVIEYPGVPQWVHGDERRVRQAISNICANAMQYTTSGFVKVEVWLQEVLKDKAIVEVIVQDSGCGMSNEKLDTLFRDLEQVTTDEDSMMDQPGQAQHQAKNNRVLGLGLAVVARIIRNMDGQLRLKSEEGKGSRFVVQVPFAIPSDDPTTSEGNSAKSLLLPVTSPPPATPDGEVTLVDKSSSVRADGVIHRKSVEEIDSLRKSLEEIDSLRSFRSGSSNKSNASKKSDVDRLIDAISGPLAVGQTESEDVRLHRRNSRGSGHNSRPSASSLERVKFATGRPGKLLRARSYGAPEHLRSAFEGPAGSEYVTDSKTLLKAVRMPDEYATIEDSPQDSRVLFDMPDKKSEQEKILPKKLDTDHLKVLVAEDDPVNSRIIQKRLERIGHEVHHTVNGEDCASAFGEKHAFFDVVLMDMQMPIVDGLASTKMIRSYEKTNPQSKLSARASLNGRVPIFAVSASLVERERQTYINAGFDGWILKPIDFKRVNVILLGIVDNSTRASCLYRPGEWEKGGWFHRRSPSPLTVVTTTSEERSERSLGKLPATAEARREVQVNKSVRSHASSEEGSVTPTPSMKQEDRRGIIVDERLNASGEGRHEAEVRGVADPETLVEVDGMVVDVTDEETSTRRS